MKKIYFPKAILISLLLCSACSLTTKATDCNGSIPVPNKDWILLSELPNKVYANRTIPKPGDKDYNKIYENFKLPLPASIDSTTVVSVKDGSHYKNKNGIYINGNKIPEACSNSFEVLNVSDSFEYRRDYDIYSKDAYQVFIGDKKIEGADPQSFTVFEHLEGSDANLAKDKSFIYNNGKKVLFLDRQSFEIVDSHFSKDKNFVYYVEDTTKSPEMNFIPLKDLDTKTFKPLGNAYGMDARSVYRFSKKLIEAEAQTFELVDKNGYFTKDKNSVFYGENKFPADPKTFMLIKEGPSSLLYTKDKDKVYLLSKEILSADPKTFEVFEQNNLFSKDKNQVYYNGDKIDEADVHTFQPLNNGGAISKDKKNIYIETKKIKGPDIASSRFLETASTSIYILDNTHAYFIENNQVIKLEGVDPKSFKIGEFTHYECTSDGKNFYKLGKKVGFCVMK